MTTLVRIRHENPIDDEIVKIDFFDEQLSQEQMQAKIRDMLKYSDKEKWMPYFSNHGFNAKSICRYIHYETDYEAEDVTSEVLEILHPINYQ